MTWWVLFFVLYVNGQPTLQIENIGNNYYECKERRIEVSKKPDVGKADCRSFSE